ncbi:Asp23/Gls24 family envelope stress response protein [Phascolarctobacterium sp.]|uniref:Asp23/Gls24 family envelope stress response protein n=1 Tax=Phascolarctobacterium sp. TaxID=2049039 RepID=UPI00386D45A9
MEVVAFVGPSGTGKSHHAIGVAFDNKCDAIIDDGLLIKGTKILAGTSAKNEQNRIQAVKRAIFTEDSHAKQVREALAKNDIKRLLIIATSDNMINKIVGRLQLNPPVKTVYINQIASKAEIKKARYSRLQEGKHIVPVPTVELKPHFTGYFADLPYNLFSSKRREEKEADRSIVRPSFSFYGKLLIADSAIEDIINIIGEKLEGVERVTDIKVRRRSDNSKGIVISVEVILYYGVQLFAVTRKMQAKIKEKVEYMTAMQVKNVNVSIRSLAVRNHGHRG